MKCRLKIKKNICFSFFELGTKLFTYLLRKNAFASKIITILIFFKRKQSSFFKNKKDAHLAQKNILLLT